MVQVQPFDKAELTEFLQKLQREEEPSGEEKQRLIQTIKVLKGNLRRHLDEIVESTNRPIVSIGFYESLIDWLSDLKELSDGF